ncbi:MAG: AraC family transcriptional regulator [Desulfarculaceae bacterium]
MKACTRDSYHERILRVLVHIQRHLDEDLSLEGLAEVANFSPYHFHRVFRGMVGEGIKEHTRRLRLERAAYQLRNTQRPVTDIALAAGYQAHESFSRAFREMFGENPTVFRELRSHFNHQKSPSGVNYRPDGKIDHFTPQDTGGAQMNVDIKKFDPMRVAFMRHMGPYATCEATWEKLCSWAGPKGLLKKDTVYVGICHDDPEITPPDKIRYDACVVVDEKTGPEGEVGVQEIAGGDYAVTVHKGPYETLKDTYARLCGEWLPNQEREKRSMPSLEIYLSDPQITPPAERLTEIRLALV